MRKLLFSLLALLLISCNSLFFYPAENYFYHPGSVGLAPEVVTFKSGDGTRLSGWFFPSLKQPVKGTVIQFHGNAQNMSTHFLLLSWITFKGYHLFTFDYRGYGKSEGNPTIQGLTLDAAAAYKYLLQRKDLEDSDFVLYGQSLGGVLLLKALADFPQKNRIRAVIAEGSFLSYQDIARNKLADTWLTWPFQHLAYLLISGEYDATQTVEAVSPIPLLVIHGTADPIVPYKFGEEIYASARQPKMLWSVPDGQHIDAMRPADSQYRKKLIQYLDGLNKRN